MIYFISNVQWIYKFNSNQLNTLEIDIDFRNPRASRTRIIIGLCVLRLRKCSIGIIWNAFQGVSTMQDWKETLTSLDIIGDSSTEIQLRCNNIPAMTVSCSLFILFIYFTSDATTTGPSSLWHRDNGNYFLKQNFKSKSKEQLHQRQASTSTRRRSGNWSISLRK